MEIFNRNNTTVCIKTVFFYFFLSHEVTELEICIGLKECFNVLGALTASTSWHFLWFNIYSKRRYYTTLHYTTQYHITIFIFFQISLKRYTILLKKNYSNFFKRSKWDTI